MLTMSTIGRSAPMVQRSLQKYIRNLDYDPTLGTEIKTDEMMIRGVYVMNGYEYVVELRGEGWTRNDFAPISSDPDNPTEIIRTGPWRDDHLKYTQRIAHFVRTDSDLSFHKFQILSSMIKDFEEMISEITRYPTHCIRPKAATQEDRKYSTDLVIDKKGYKIHFKRMSAGEKKICKSFSELLNLIWSLENPSPGDSKMEGWPRILLIDNVEMHVYYDRHVKMVDRLKQVFNRQQIFATTHSEVLIRRFLEKKNDQETEMMVDLEKIID